MYWYDTIYLYIVFVIDCLLPRDIEKGTVKRQRMSGNGTHVTEEKQQEQMAVEHSGRQMERHDSLGSWPDQLGSNRQCCGTGTIYVGTEPGAKNTRKSHFG